LDGGGTRGLFTARLIQRLALAVPTFLGKVDLFAGTSTGGILALGLAAGFTPDELVAIYFENASRIFDGDTLTSIEQLTEPKYGHDGLMAVLKEKFGDKTLGDLSRPVLVTTYSCKLRKPIDLTQWHDPKMPVVDAGLMTSAAPVYFPPFNEDFIDGGMTANNPSDAAIAWVVNKGAKDPKEIKVLSIGTGNADRPPMTPGRWGAIDWLKNGLIDLMFEGPSERSTLNAQRLLGDRFYPLDGKVDCAMDETTDLENRLIKPADTLLLTGALDFIRGNEHLTSRPATEDS
jgi:patatin-like phospholipase/acyl hydrolase